MLRLSLRRNDADPGSDHFRRMKARYHMAKRNDDNDKDQNYDPKGAHGGDTGPTAPIGTGPQAEKGDQRRDMSYHSGTTRRGAQGTASKHGKRSGSESNAS
jgi:hypothetical protein